MRGISKSTCIQISDIDYCPAISDDGYLPGPESRHPDSRGYWEWRAISLRLAMYLLVVLVLLFQSSYLLAQVVDCNGNGIDDATEINSGLSDDCNLNGIPDGCDLITDPTLDCDLNGLPDSCEPVGVFGLSTALGESSAIDGDTVAISDPAGGAGAGTVEIYSRVGTFWTLEETLSPGDGLAGDLFGGSLSLSGDTLVVGSPGRDLDTGNIDPLTGQPIILQDVGRAIVYLRTLTGWVQVQILVADIRQELDTYGFSVAARGSRIAVGATQETVGGNTGFVDLWDLVGNSWDRSATLSPSGLGNVGDKFGTALALTSTQLLVGSPGFDPNAAAGNSGGVTTFFNQAGTWINLGTLISSNPESGARFGTSLSATENELVVGAPGGGNQTGRAYIFASAAATWVETDVLVGPVAGAEEFGESVSLALNTLVVGEPQGNQASGRIHLYDRLGGVWTLRSTLTRTPSLQGDRFGSSLAITDAYGVFTARGAPSSDLFHIETTPDCNNNGIDDRCDLSSAAFEDCNANSRPDVCDITDGLEVDCDTNGIPDSCQIANGASLDCNLNNIPDLCDLAAAGAQDCNLNGIPDDCETDCNSNGIPDQCDLDNATSPDCNVNGIPDECDITLGFSIDCNTNGVPDECDLQSASSLDCNLNNTPDECDIATGVETDCNGNLVPDACELATGSGQDCNLTGILDECELASGISPDCNANTIPDECDLSVGTDLDCNLNGTLDSCDIANGVVVDNTPPLISGSPGDQLVSTPVGTCVAISFWGEPQATDECVLVSFSSDIVSGATFNVGTTVVTYTAVDSFGNSSTLSFNVIVTDDEFPVISGMPADISVTNEPGSCGSVASWTAPTSTDNCGIATLISSHSQGSFFDVGTTPVTYIATDVNGNSTQASFNITVIDNEALQITGMPASSSHTNDPGVCGALVTWIAPTASDNCVIASLIPSQEPDTIFAIGTTTVTYTAVNVSGETALASFDVTVTDDELPVISGMPASLSQTNDPGACSAAVTWTAPTSSDNCPIATLTTTHEPGNTFAVGTTTVTYSTTDIHGNGSSASFD
ncbi:MAG TPA: HYR domain-containing protein, partial [Planctomycetes bacterium]|nr:HYR domain-containing protein [Planctomycetota bacterium]